jgi:hypothetical protein
MILYDEFDPSIIVCDPMSNMIRRIRLNINLETLEIDSFLTENLITENLKYIDYDGREMEFEPLGYFREPRAVSMDPISKDLFISDSENHCIRRLDLRKKTVKMFAGIYKHAGYADGDCYSARFDNPLGSIVHDQKLWVCDFRNSCIRIVDLQTQVVATVSGNPLIQNILGDFQNRQLLRDLTWNGPRSITKDRFGRLVITDSKNALIRIVIPKNGIPEDEFITFSLGGGTNEEVFRSSIGKPKIEAKPPLPDNLNFPFSVAFDPWNNFLISDQANHRIVLMQFPRQNYEIAISIFMSSIKHQAKLYPYFHHPLFDTNIIRMIFHFYIQKKSLKSIV